MIQARPQENDRPSIGQETAILGRGDRPVALGRSVVALAVLSLSVSACAMETKQPSSDCGADIIELFVEGDPETVALYERSETEFQERWIERVRCLAERGDAESQLKLGIAYRDGSDGPAQDYTEAAFWFRQAAEQGHPMARFNLGRLYERGLGVPRDLITAHLWYNLAASGFEPRDGSRTMAIAGRDRVASQLTAADLRKAYQLASEWSSRRP